MNIKCKKCGYRQPDECKPPEPSEYAVLVSQVLRVEEERDKLKKVLGLVAEHCKLYLPKDRPGYWEGKIPESVVNEIRWALYPEVREED